MNPNIASIFSRRQLFAALLALGALGGCASHPAKPEQRSASDLRFIAGGERAEAAYEKKVYESPSAEPMEDSAVGRAEVRSDARPSIEHLDRAAALEAHARAHEKAAVALETFESKACVGISPAARRACPFLGIQRIRDLDDGIRLYVPKDAPIDDLVALMRCHYAFAETQGFSDAVSCPLFIRGLDIRASKARDAIDLVSKDYSVVVEIQRRGAAETDVATSQASGPTL